MDLNINVNHEEMNAINEQRIKAKDDQIIYLWKLLDDISTAGDIFKPEIDDYFKYVNKKCEERSEVANSTDGYAIVIIEVGQAT